MGLERWVLLLQLGLSWDPLQPRMALIPDASHYASAVPWSVLCLALFLITFINVLQTTIWRTVKKLRGGGGGGSHRFYGLDRTVPCVRSRETCSRAPWPAWKIKESGRVGPEGRELRRAPKFWP